MQIELTNHFLKMVCKLQKSEQVILSKKVGIFKNNPQDPRLRTHFLTGKLKNIQSFSLNYSKRVLFVVDKNKFIFIAVGTHDQVYRKM
jgi:mRNA-degrading endonuclease YafQ of YafQ-DinJ toxin-antitoxin module